MRHMRSTLTWALLLAVITTPAWASAQDMSFEPEETGQAPAPPAEGPPSETLANALRLYQQERYAESAVQFQRVVEGGTDDAAANRQKAEFFLGKALYHLRFYQLALVVFDAIGEAGTSHLYFDQTLSWLAQLASQLPEPAGIIEKVGRYGVDQLEQFNTPESEELYSQLLYLMGRFKYKNNELDEAVNLFGRVDRGSRWFVQAKFFEGITQVRLRRAQPAIGSFRAILEALDEGAEGVEDEDRMRNLAWLSLARVYYTASNRTDPNTGDREVDGRLLGNAVEAWNRVEQGSEYWLDALFEESWAFFLASEYSRALGNVHTLYSPYFTDAYYPEALVIKAVTFFENCQMDNADAIIGQFHERYDPVQQELNAILTENGEEDNLRFFEFLQRVRAGQANLSPRIRALVTTALSDRDLLRHLEYVRVLEAEEARLEQSPPEFRGSSLGDRILQEIGLAKNYAVEEAGDKARGRYLRLVEELQGLLNQVDTIEIEILNWRRDVLDAALQDQLTTARQSRGGDVEVDEEHQMWPFNGEYWRDELGFYRQQVTNQCGR